MKKLLLTLGLAFALSGTVSAAPIPCASGVDVTTIGPDGCLIGDLIFKNFSVTVSGSGLTTATISFGAFTGPDPFSSNGAAAQFVVSHTPSPTSPPADIIFRYEVLGGPQTGVTASIAGGSNVSVIESVCDVPLTVLGACNSPNSGWPVGQTANVPGGPAEVTTMFPNQVAHTYIYKDIQFQANGAISDFTNVHHAVPEPTTSLLMGTALLGLALLRKRYAQK